MARLLQGNVRVEGVDHEDFTSNEHPSDKLRDFQIVLHPGQPEQTISDVSLRAADLAARGGGQPGAQPGPAPAPPPGAVSQQ